MKLLGAFNPKLQVIYAAATIAVYVIFVLELWEVDFAQLDIRVAPFVFLAGILFGLPVGSMRLRALRKVLPQVDGHFYLGERGVLSRVREGENAMTLQRNAWVVAFLIWFAAATRSRLFYVSLASFIVGSYLTGQALPFIRLWIELSKSERDAKVP